MKNLIFSLFAIVLSTTIIFGQKQIKISANTEAKIYVDGFLYSGSPVQIKLPRKGCVNVRVKQEGYESATRTYCRSDKNPKNAEFIELKKSEKQVKVIASSSARIFVDGKYVTSGSTILKIGQDSRVNVQVKEPGYLMEERNYMYNGLIELPKEDHIQLSKDEAFHSSFNTDFANTAFSLYPARKESETWRILSQIITSYFDVLEVMDLNTGYMRTAWVSKNFNSGTVRTRAIIKMGGSAPLSYKIKLVSEFSDIPGASIKEDENFQEWDRILRVYEPMVSELQSRLKKGDTAIVTSLRKG